MKGRTQKQPAPQLVDKPMRMTRTKRAALEALESLGSDFLEWGVPPYSVSLLARRLGVDLSNLAKTMQGLERAGLVVREVATVECWNAITRGHMPRRCVCYWLAASMDEDKARAQVWRAGAGARSERAFNRLFATPGSIDVSDSVLP